MPLFALLVLAILPEPDGWDYALATNKTQGYAGFYFRQKQKVIAWYKASLGDLDPGFARQQEDIARANEIRQREDGPTKLAVVGPIPGCDFGIMVKPIASDGQANMPYQEPLGLEAALADFDIRETNDRPGWAARAPFFEAIDQMPDRFKPR